MSRSAVSATTPEQRELSDREVCLDELARRRCELAGVAWQREAPVGDPATTIVETAEAAAVCYTVMATHGRSRFKRWRLGSAADRALCTTSTPTVLIRSKEEGEGIGILVPLDGSQWSESALPEAAKVGWMTGSSLHLLRTVTAIVAAAPAGIYATYEEANRAAAQAAAKYLTATGERVEGVAVETSVVVGHPSMAVIEAAKAADLVVMASHGHSGFKRMLLGSVTDATIRGSGKLMLMGPHHKEWRRRPRRRSVREVRDPPRHRGTGGQGEVQRFNYMQRATCPARI